MTSYEGRRSSGVGIGGRDDGGGAPPAAGAAVLEGNGVWVESSSSSGVVQKGSLVAQREVCLLSL